MKRHRNNNRSYAWMIRRCSDCGYHRNFGGGECYNYGEDDPIKIPGGAPACENYLAKCQKRDLRRGVQRKHPHVEGEAE